MKEKVKVEGEKVREVQVMEGTREMGLEEEVEGLEGVRAKAEVEEEGEMEAHSSGHFQQIQ